MKIPVTILTYQRPEYLKLTLESFLDLNGTERFIFFILAQGSDPETRKVLEPYAKLFEHQWHLDLNLGCSGGYSFIMRRVLDWGLESPYIFHLQDDWELRESLLPYLDEILALLRISPDIGYVRLRTVKSRVAKTNRVTQQRIVYRKRSPNVYVGNAHFSLNPSIARNSTIEQMLPIRKELDAMHKYDKLNLLTGQLDAKCFVHIGSKRAMTTVPGKEGNVWIS